MDEATLKKILHGAPAPKPDENAKKRALNLAMAAFDEEQKKNKKTSQGFSILSRLMGYTTQNARSETMETKTKKRMIYGGMGTAMAVVLMTGIAITQTSQMANELGAKKTVITLNDMPENTADPLKEWRQEQDKKAGASANSQAATPAYVQDTPVKNPAQLEEALRKGESKIPTPAAPAKLKSEGDFHRWRQTTPTPQAVIATEQGATRALEAAPAAPPVAALEKKTSGMVTGQLQAFTDADAIVQPVYKDVGRDKFEHKDENGFKMVAEEPVSTFSSDVDTASYAFIRRQLNNGILPQKDAVRIEEMVNYFHYNYPVPESREEPFKPTITITDSPWKPGKKLLHIGIKGYEITGEKPRSNLVFLVDTSGSMQSPDKLPLLVNSLKLLLDSLQPSDTVAIAAYAGSAGTVLEPTKVSDKAKIIAALDNLQAGGSTAGAEGIRLAYQLAEQNLEKDAVNRVILATDGDFNVGITNQNELKDYIERERDSGIFLSVLGFGQGNYNDAMMQTLAQNGNGVAAYIDTLGEARKVLVEEASSTLFTIAKDVKFQVEFNPARVSEYRLIGYETRALNREDFNNDKVDAGDIGSGHAVTAIYEFTPAGEKTASDPLRYGEKNDEPQTVSKTESNEYAFVKIRYKLPKEDTSKLITTPVTEQDDASYCPPNALCKLRAVPDDVQFSTAVAAFGQILKGGKYTGNYSFDDVIALAQQGKGADEYGYRSDFIQLVRLAKSARKQ